jgi:hypothetical protein
MVDQVLAARLDVGELWWRVGADRWPAQAEQCEHGGEGAPHPPLQSSAPTSGAAIRRSPTPVKADITNFPP